MREHICVGPKESQADATGPTMEGLCTIALPCSAGSAAQQKKLPSIGRDPGRSRCWGEIKASNGRAHRAFRCGSAPPTLIRITTDLILRRTSWCRNFDTTAMTRAPGPTGPRRPSANPPATPANAGHHTVGHDLAASLVRQQDCPGVKTIRRTPVSSLPTASLGRSFIQPVVPSCRRAALA